MLVSLMLRQGELRSRNKRGVLTCGEMVELIGINEILENSE